jgi:hypothetical protein
MKRKKKLVAYYMKLYRHLRIVTTEEEKRKRKKNFLQASQTDGPSVGVTVFIKTVLGTS